ncbi:MAG: hypothetical protein JO032_02745 [Alphaproteobacteria bacterium]|nr:hypothetical protein [Alphaproteobacteria bacterium]
MKLAEDAGLAYPRKMVESILVGLSDPLNDHLIKLIGFDFPAEARQHFHREVRTWLKKIQILRFKPNNRTGSVKFYFDFLFDYPFGGVEEQNVRRIANAIADEYEHARPTKSPRELVEWLHSFHRELAQRLHRGEDVLDMIPE